MSHSSFAFSFQLLCPDKDDLMYVSLRAGPELNPKDHLCNLAVVSIQLSSCFFPGLQPGGGQMAFSTSAHAAQAQSTRVHHKEELTAPAYFP